MYIFADAIMITNSALKEHTDSTLAPENEDLDVCVCEREREREIQQSTSSLWCIVGTHLL